MENGLIFPIVFSNERENSFSCKNIFSSLLCDDLDGWDGPVWGGGVGGLKSRVKRKEIYVYIELTHFVVQ